MTDGSEPTLEQCERLSLTLGFPLLPESLRPPFYEESMRNLHALAQKALLGDKDAGARLALLRERFGKDTLSIFAEPTA